MKDDLTQSQVRELLDYDPETGVFIWRVDRVGGNGTVVKAAGSVAGCASMRETNSYLHIVINGRSYGAHRLAWLIMTGSWPAKDIDHKDGDGLNNQWINLREATSSQNCANKRLRRDNTSGAKGVSWRPDLGKWKATITAEGKTRHLGFFVDKDDAAAAYEAAATEHFGEFARTG